MDWKLSLLSFLATAFPIKLVASQAATEPYNFSELKFYNEYVTYDAASRACENDNAKLVVIKDENLQNVITNKLATINGSWLNSNMYPWRDGYWIGGRKIAGTTTWLWSDGSPVPQPGSTTGYQNWFGVEPNSFTSDDGCIVVTPRDTIQSYNNVRGGWVDDVCNANKYYLCNRHYCSTNPCVKGTCINLENNYKCDCESGYIGKDCDRDYCTSNNCTNGATCMIKPTNYTCNCPTEYIGTYCEIRDETSTSTSIVGWLIPIILLVCLVVILVVIIIRRKRNTESREKNSENANEDPSMSQSPYEVVNISVVSPQYVNIETGGNADQSHHYEEIVEPSIQPSIYINSKFQR